MGVTSFDIPIIEKYRGGYESVVYELGAQNNYSQPHLPAPYMKDWYEERGVICISFDISGENGCEKVDLSIDLKFDHKQGAEFVTDLGTSEHIRDYYNCWLNKWNLCRIGGIIFSENPKTGNWPGHGFNYITTDFYKKLSAITDSHILELGEHPAMGNTTDGWNVYCVMYKSGTRFPSREEFEKLPVYGS